MTKKTFIFLVICLLVCFTSFIAFESCMEQLDRTKKNIKVDYFQPPGVKYSIPFNGFVNGKCSLYLYFYTGNEFTIQEVHSPSFNIVSIELSLKDINNNIIKKEYYKDYTGFFSAHWKNDGIEWNIIYDFESEKGKEYKLDISINSEEQRFNNKFFEIYIQRTVDTAALGYIYLFKLIYKLLIIISLLAILITLSFYQYKIYKKEKEINLKKHG